MIYDNCYAGGHTAEMLSIVNVLLKDRFAPRFYVAAATDNMSLQKARVLEDSLVQHGEVYLLHILFIYFPRMLFFLASLFYLLFMFPFHVQWFEHNFYVPFVLILSPNNAMLE